MFEGLSYDDRPDFEQKIRQVAAWIESHFELFFDASTSLKSFYDLGDLKEFPSIQFGLEQLKSSFLNKDPFCLFDTDFYQNQKGDNNQWFDLDGVA